MTKRDDKATREGFTPEGVAGAAGSAYLQSQGIDPSLLSDPNPQKIATAALTAYLVSMGVPPFLAGPIADKVVGAVMSGDISQLNPVDLLGSDAIKEMATGALNDFLAENGVDPAAALEAAGNIIDDVANLGNMLDGLKDDILSNIPSVDSLKWELPLKFKLENIKIIPTDVKISPTTGNKDSSTLTNVHESDAYYQQANEAVDINRYRKDMVKGFLPPMNWWDKMPDWPAISYTSIIMDQTRAAKKYILDGIPLPDETEAEIESHKYPYKSMAVSTLMKGKVDPGTKKVVLGQELIQKSADDKDTIEDTESFKTQVPKAIVNEVTQTNSKYFPIAPTFAFPEVYRDDLTDQKNPALDLVDTQKLVDEFLDIGKRIYDQQTENPTIFGFDDINSKYEKDKNIVLANYKQYKANIRRMEHINNIIESKSNDYLIENITTRHDIPNCSTAEEFCTRYLREKLLAWYNETADPQTKTWTEYHWLPGEPGYIEMLLTVGDYEWYDNLVAGLEDSVARLEDLEATLDLLASMANAAGTIAKYSTAVEIAEKIVETPDWDWKNTVTFTNEMIDETMLKDLLGVSEIIGSLGGEITAIRAELEGLRWSNQAILEEVRIMAPTFLAYPIIWTKLQELCAQVNADIFGFLNTLILNKRGDNETVGWHSSPSHLMLDISEQLAKICETVQADVQNIIDTQAALPQQGKNRLDSMLNKINEIRLWGPLCSIPWHYWMAIDNVNAAERLYNDIWSDVFDCWEREYIIRNWRILVEHHLGGVIPNTFYGKPLFSAQCPHHLPLLLAPVPVDYRDIDINYLSANCRKNFNFLTSWLTSALYAIGIKRTALSAVINDTSLNGNDENIAWLTELNTLNEKNLIIKDEIDKAISQYNGTGELLPKADLDEIIAAKELSPTRYSNQTLMNMSSELHLLNTDPVTVLNLATNENRTGTTVSDSPPLEWKKIILPSDMSPEAAEAFNEAVKKGKEAELKIEEKKKKIYKLEQKQLRGQLTPEELEELKELKVEVKKMEEPDSEEKMAINAMNEALSEFTVADVLKVNTIPTVGGPAEVIVDTGVSADDDSSTQSSYVGDVEEFMPWKYMQPNWDTQRELNEIPVVVPPEPAPVIPEPPEVEFPEEAPKPDKIFEAIKIEPELIESLVNKVKELDPKKMAKDYLSNLPIDLNDPILKEVAKKALSAYLQSQGIPAILADQLADMAVEEAAKQLSEKGSNDRINNVEDPMVQAKAKMVDDLMKTVSSAIKTSDQEEKHT